MVATDPNALGWSGPERLVLFVLGVAGGVLAWFVAVRIERRQKAQPQDQRQTWLGVTMLVLLIAGIGLFALAMMAMLNTTKGMGT
jgi:NO-binding membrane sensor protein with MHYT domain